MYLLNYIKFSFPRKLYVLYNVNSDPSDSVLFPSFNTFAMTSLSITDVSTYFVFENSDQSLACFLGTNYIIWNIDHMVTGLVEGLLK